MTLSLKTVQHRREDMSKNIAAWVKNHVIFSDVINIEFDESTDVISMAGLAIIIRFKY